MQSKWAMLHLPSSSSLSSRRASLLSRRNCFSISWLMRFCSLASSDKQHSMLTRFIDAFACCCHYARQTVPYIKCMLFGWWDGLLDSLLWTLGHLANWLYGGRWIHPFQVIDSVVVSIGAFVLRLCSLCRPPPALTIQALFGYCYC